MLMAIGEPELVDTASIPACRGSFPTRCSSSIRRSGFLRHGGGDRADRAYFRHAAQGLEERSRSSTCSARSAAASPRWPRSSSADGEGAVLRHQGLAGARVAARAVRPRGGRRAAGEGLRHPAPLPEHHHVALGGQAPATSTAATSPVPGGQAAPVGAQQIAIAKTEPGDENNQDISSLVGKVDIRKLEQYSQDDPDAYSYSGGLCLANQGLLEFVEMFKAPIKVLHPLLTATQEGNYKGTEGIRRDPFDGIVLAHSNESEWQSFKNNKQQRGLPRPHLHRQGALLPAGVRGDQDLREAARAQLAGRGALRARHPAMMAQFAVLSRLKEPENSSIYSKMRVYDGENLKDTDPKAKSMQEYRDYAGVDEGMTGLSTRFAFKILSKVFNFDHREVAANPVHLLYVLEQQIEQEQFPPETEERYLGFIKEYLAPRYAEFIGKEIQTAYLESYSEYGQNIFDRYVTYADFWIQDQEYRDPDTGEILDRAGAQRGAREDREAGRHQQSQGLPQRGRQLRAAGARPEQRQEPELDQSTRSCAG
jgi:serine protein kinase